MWQSVLTHHLQLHRDHPKLMRKASPEKRVPTYISHSLLIMEWVTHQLLSRRASSIRHLQNDQFCGSAENTLPAPRSELGRVLCHSYIQFVQYRSIVVKSLEVCARVAL